MNIKQKKMLQRRITIVLGILLVVGVVVYMYASNALTIYKLEKQKEEILQGIENEEIRSNQLDEEVELMGSRSYVEYVARKYLGLYYPDETIVIPVVEDETQESEGQ